MNTLVKVCIAILVATLRTGEVYSSYSNRPTATTHVLDDGYIADTHDVSVARSQHLAAVAKAKAHRGYDEVRDYENNYERNHERHDGNTHLNYHGPNAIPKVPYDRLNTNTQEVSVSNAKHLVTIGKPHGSYEETYGIKNNYGRDHERSYSNDNREHLRYHGSNTIQHVDRDGHIAKPHQVAVGMLPKASNHRGYGKTHIYENNYKHDHERSYSQEDQGNLRYDGPTAIPQILHDGHIADTHEVAAARLQHLTAVAKARTHRGYVEARGYENNNENDNKRSPSHEDHVNLRYHGPTAIPQVLHDGHIADTHEVAAAKAEHFAAVAKASTHGGHGEGHGYEYNYEHVQEHSNSHDDHGHLRYHGHTAIPHVLHDGHIADTHEVAAARLQHLAAVAKARTHGGYVEARGYENNNENDHVLNYSHDDHENQRYYGTKPILNELLDGHIANTQEGDFIAGAKASTHGGYVEDHGYENNYEHDHGQSYSHDDHGNLRYHGPPAIPHVLHDGHIANTHEVAAARLEHLAAVAKASTQRGFGKANSHENYYEHDHERSYSHDDHINQRYHGPIATPHDLHDRHIANTREGGLAAAAKASTHTSYVEAHGYENNYEHDHERSYSHDDHGNLRYHGPTAIPHVLHDGHIADTHEVAAAKVKHLAAVATVNKAHADYYGTYKNHGSITNTVAAKYGYFADNRHVKEHEQKSQQSNYRVNYRSNY